MCTHFWCIFGTGESYMPIFSYKMALPEDKELFSQCPKKMFWGRWLSPFAARHFRNSHCPARSLPGMFVGWEKMCFAKWSWSGKRGQSEWMRIVSEELGNGDLRWMCVKEMGRGRQGKTPGVWESFRWGNVFLGMRYFQPGVTNSVA